MKLTCKFAVLATLALMGCAGFKPFGPSKSQESQSGEVINAINYFEEDGSEAWLIDCTRSRTQCIKRASKICEGAYNASFLDGDSPLKNAVELAPALETTPRSGKDVFTMSAICGAA